MASAAAEGGNPRIGPARVLRAAGLAFVVAVSLLATGQPVLAAGPTAVELGTTTLSAGPTTVRLGTAAPFAVLAGTPAVTNTGPTIITGDLGIDPWPTVAGFPSGTVNGTIHRADVIAHQAQSDLVTAYTDAAGRPATAVHGALGGLTLVAGVYNAGGVTLDLTGSLTLDGQHDPNAVWIFQATSDLVTAPSSSVQLVNGANACNVFWQVAGSATLGAESTFVGSVLALTSIIVNTHATVNGRALARNGEVTLADDTIARSECAAPVQVTLAAAGGPIPPSQSAAPDTGRSSETLPVIPALALLFIVLAIILGEADLRPRDADTGARRRGAPVQPAAGGTVAVRLTADRGRVSTSSLNRSGRA